MSSTGEWAAEKLDEADRPGRIERAARELCRLRCADWDTVSAESRENMLACAASILDAADGEEVRPCR